MGLQLPGFPANIVSRGCLWLLREGELSHILRETIDVNGDVVAILTLAPRQARRAWASDGPTVARAVSAPALTLFVFTARSAATVSHVAAEPAMASSVSALRCKLHVIRAAIVTQHEPSAPRGALEGAVVPLPSMLGQVTAAYARAIQGKRTGTH